MTRIVYSAHDLCRTRLCQAAGCEHDAEPGWALCRACDKRWHAGREIVLHIIEQPRQPDREKELICTRCGDWKPDDQFRRDGSRGARRGRKSECRPCDTKRRIAYRAKLSPERLEAERERDRKRQADKLAARRAAKDVA